MQNRHVRIANKIDIVLCTPSSALQLEGVSMLNFSSVLKCRGEVISPKEADREIATEVTNLRIEVLRSLLERHEREDVIVHVPQIEYQIRQNVCH